MQRLALSTIRNLIPRTQRRERRRAAARSLVGRLEDGVVPTMVFAPQHGAETVVNLTK
jgi:hypothetical protein